MYEGISIINVFLIALLWNFRNHPFGIIINNINLLLFIIIIILSYWPDLKCFYHDRGRPFMQGLTNSVKDYFCSS